MLSLKLGHVSRSWALVVCSLCYFLGRYSVPSPVDLQVQMQVPGRIAKETATPTTSLGNAAPATGPALLTNLVEESGLLEVKPNVPTGLSGNTEYTVAPFQVLSWYPRTFVYPNFVDAERCQHIINLARDKVTPSEVQPKLNDPGNGVTEERTSSGTFVSPDDDPAGVLAWVEERIAAITQLPVEYGEDFNILRYNKDQYYESHLDAFDPKEYGAQESQRIATVLVILQAPEEGGETVFKREGKGNAKKDVREWRKCLETDFKYTPRQGDALVFWSVTPKGKIDEQALHGGCPVTKGEKWVATKWIRNKAQR